MHVPSQYPIKWESSSPLVQSLGDVSWLVGWVYDRMVSFWVPRSQLVLSCGNIGQAVGLINSITMHWGFGWPTTSRLRKWFSATVNQNEWQNMEMDRIEPFDWQPSDHFVSCEPDNDSMGSLSNSGHSLNPSMSGLWHPSFWGNQFSVGKFFVWVRIQSQFEEPPRVGWGPFLRDRRRFFLALRSISVMMDQLVPFVFGTHQRSCSKALVMLYLQQNNVYAM